MKFNGFSKSLQPKGTELGQEIDLLMLLLAESVPNVQIPCAVEHVGSGPDYLTLKTPLITLVKLEEYILKPPMGNQPLLVVLGAL